MLISEPKTRAEMGKCFAGSGKQELKVAEIRFESKSRFQSREPVCLSRNMLLKPDKGNLTHHMLGGRWHCC